MIKICVVGEIGSGKTYISKLFSPKKNLIFNADIEVNKIYKRHRPTFAKLKKNLPLFIKLNMSENQNFMILFVLIKIT